MGIKSHAKQQKEIVQNAEKNGANNSGGKPKAAKSSPKSTKFDCREDGVYFIETNESGDKRDVKICSRLCILATTRDKDSTAWGKLLEITDGDGRKHLWSVPMSLLERMQTDFRAHLAHLGLEITQTQREKSLLAQYVSSTKTDKQVLCVSQIGWHDSCFVLPDKTFGDSDRNTVIYQTESMPEHRFGAAGTLNDWQEKVAAFCVGNTNLVFSVSAAFAPCILQIIGAIDAGGFHFLGETSLGKSTALIVAGSVCGGGDDKLGFCDTWKSTANGFEAIAETHNHSLLCLDEIKLCDNKIVGNVAYLLANGQGKNRMSQSIGLRKRLTWSLIFLSSGELSLQSYIEQSGERFYGGQNVRLCDVPADTKRHGIFENLHGFDAGDKFSNFLQENAKRNYGTALDAFLTELVKTDKNEIRQKWETYRDEFIKSVSPEKASREVVRVASRFALIGFAGELAKDVTKWTNETATEAARVLFVRWLDGRESSGDKHDADACIKQIASFLETHGANRFPKITDDENTSDNRAGFTRENPTTFEKEFLIFTDTFKRDVCKGFSLQTAVDELTKRGLLVRGNDKARPTQQIRVKHLGKNPIRFYVISSKVFGDGETETNETENDF